MTFDLLHPAVRELLVRGPFSEPTPPQRAAIPSIMEGKSVLLIAPTGMGKTEAALLPLFSRLLELKRTESSAGFRLIYVTPLRALNRDMMKRMRSWAGELGLSIGVRHGDTSQYERTKMSRKPPEVLITTPETLQILFTGKRLRRHLRTTRYLVVDEIHELAEGERGWQMAVAVERLDALTGYRLQRVGLSATVGNPEEMGHFLVGVGRDVDVLRIDAPKKVDHSVLVPEVVEGDGTTAAFGPVSPEMAASVRACMNLIREHSSSLLFVNTRDTAESFANLFARNYPDLAMGIHHGSLSTDVRVAAEDDFKDGKLKGMVCTSSLELGIDIGKVDLSLQFNSPRTVSRLIQRFGRAGHSLGDMSKGIVVTTDFDETLEALACMRLAGEGKAEPVEIRQKPLSVLANQLISVTLQSDTSTALPLDALYRIFVRAWPFRELKPEELSEMVAYLREIRMFFYEDGGGVARTRRSREYFYSNISMIPDERSFKVVDITTRRPVAQVDESFVATYLSPFSTFIVKGASWRVVQIEEDVVTVEPIADPGALPGWVGEDLPVPFSVARYVGGLRRSLMEHLEGRDDPGMEWMRRHINKAGMIMLEGMGRRMAEGEYSMAMNDTIVVERGLNTLVLNCCFGTRVNQTLGQFLSSMIGGRLGAAVGLTSDAYRIILELPEHIDPMMIDELLMSVEPGEIRNLMLLVLRNSEHMKWRFVHVGKKFGALKKELDTMNVNIDRLLENFRDTPIYRETLDKIMADQLDITNAGKVLEELQSGKVRIVHTRLSPVGRLGFRRTRDLLAPEREDRSVLLALKKRLEGEALRLVCLSCGTTRRVVISRAPDDLRCTNCGSVLVAAVSTYDRDAEKLVRTGTSSRAGRTPAQEKEFRRLLKNANLVMEYGKQALLVLCAHGIGPDTAARILAKQYSEDVEIQMLREILEKEINYMRTKRFWD